MSDQFRVGEFAELCNFPGELARFNGVEVLIVELAAHREWRRVSDDVLCRGVAYLVSWEEYPECAIPPKYLRKRRKPIDTVDATTPNKITQWSDGPWKPETRHV